MHSLRTKITMLTVCVVMIAVTVVTVLSVVFIRNNDRRKSDQLLLLLCETGERNLDCYFSSVEKSVKKVSAFAEEHLDGLSDGQLAANVETVGKYFEEMAYKTNGVLTYYYRIDPAVSSAVKGFWYTDLNGEGFAEHEVTDITLYDTEDTSRLVWFTVPKHTGKTVWLPPYVTDNLDVRVISCNVPIYWHGNFVGVVGIELDYTTMAEQVRSIRLYGGGYAFVIGADGAMIYHPYIDAVRITQETTPRQPEGMESDSTFFRYTYDGVEKEAAWLRLYNGMKLIVSVPVYETEGNWQDLIFTILIASGGVLAVLSLFTLLFTRRITRPLEKLTAAAEQVNAGNYDFDLDYQGKDEVGKLTVTFKRLANHMKDHINDLSKRAYVDALTSVRNKGAYTNYIESLQERLDKKEPLAFAVGVFDCDNLKGINDKYGHDKGDLYLKTACQLICRMFRHSAVFRTGGDEFAAVLMNDDFINREELISRFKEESRESCESGQNAWEQVRLSMGVAVYSQETDKTVLDTVRRADKTMYENKKVRKGIA